MGQRLHKRLPKGFVEEVLEVFNEGRVTAERACELLGIKTARLYRMRRDWLRCRMRGEEFRLWNRRRSDFNRFSEEVTVCLISDLKIMSYKGGDNLCEYHL